MSANPTSCWFLSYLSELTHKDPLAADIISGLITIPVTDITDTSATAGGQFTSFTTPFNYKAVEWDVSNTFLNRQFLSGGSGQSSYTIPLTGLFPNTTYFVRAYIGMDSFHIQYANTVSFTTLYTPGNYLVSTLSGTGQPGFQNGDISQATFDDPAGAAFDNSGNIYIADAANSAVRRISPSGEVSTLAMLPSHPYDLITDPSGNVYTVTGYDTIYKITASGQVSILALLESMGTNSSASAVTVAKDPAGNIYVGARLSFQKITPAGVVDSGGHETSLKISGGVSYFTELRSDTAGNLYAVGVANNKIWKISPGGATSVIAGTGAVGDQDGNSGMATFNAPEGLALDNAGNIIVADWNNNKIRKITPR